MIDTEALQCRLQDLQLRAADCVRLLREAADELHERRHGPPRQLVNELRQISEDYDAIRHELLPDRLDESRPPSLPELVLACGQLHTRQLAAGLLDRVLNLVRNDGTPFPPLEQCQADARRLRADLLASHSVRTMEVAQSLVSGEHPLAALLELVTLGSILSDEQWARQQDVIVTACGRELAVAVARRKLACRTTVHASTTEAGMNGSLIAPV